MISSNWAIPTSNLSIYTEVEDLQLEAVWFKSFMLQKNVIFKKIYTYIVENQAIKLTIALKETSPNF